MKHHTKSDLLNGAQKRTHTPAVHDGMHAKQIAGAGVGGISHATAGVAGGVTIPTSKAAAPLAHAYGGKPNLKAGKAVAAVPGQRRRATDAVGPSRPGENHARGGPHNPTLGEAMLQQAFDASAPDDRAAHGRKS